jgi:hypothetical protein
MRFNASWEFVLLHLWRFGMVAIPKSRGLWQANRRESVGIEKWRAGDGKFVDN